MRTIVACALVLAVLLGGCASEPAEQGSSRDGLHPIVPSVVGMELTKAESALEEAGFEVGQVVPGRSNASAKVVRQEPVAGTAVPRGGTIDLTLEAAEQ